MLAVGGLVVDTRASVLYASFFLVSEAGQGRAVQLVKREKGQE
jgi:hypothetical protein